MSVRVKIHRILKVFFVYFSFCSLFFVPSDDHQFPMLRPSAIRLWQRVQRLRQQQPRLAAERQRRAEQLRQTHHPKYATLTGRRSRSRSRPIRSAAGRGHVVDAPPRSFFPLFFPFPPTQATSAGRSQSTSSRRRTRSPSAPTAFRTIRSDTSIRRRTSTATASGATTRPAPLAPIRSLFICCSTISIIFIVELLSHLFSLNTFITPLFQFALVITFLQFSIKCFKTTNEARPSLKIKFYYVLICSKYEKRKNSLTKSPKLR